MGNFNEVKTKFNEKLKEFEKRVGVPLNKIWVFVMIDMLEDACKKRDKITFRFYAESVFSVLSYFNCCIGCKASDLVYEFECFLNYAEDSFFK